MASHSSEMAKSKMSKCVKALYNLRLGEEQKSPFNIGQVIFEKYADPWNCAGPGADHDNLLQLYQISLYFTRTHLFFFRHAKLLAAQLDPLFSPAGFASWL